MKNSTRILVNTLAQYLRTVINILLSLYTVRIILEVLGADDYGIYTLVAGVTSMLAFMTNALVSSTQRFMSYYQGRGDVEKLKMVFSNSEFIHLLIGGIISFALYIIAPLLFNGFLNIPQPRVEAAISVYNMVVILLFVSFITAPFRALLISHENIVYISIIDVLDGVLKVVLILFLPHIEFDSLIVYAIMMLAIQLFNLFALGIYSFFKFEECIFPRFRYVNKSYIKELSSFAGWVIYGTGCAMGRTQGLAIVINKFLSTAANAAYGIGLQIAGAVGNISVALLNAMRPQIVKAEGAGDRVRALNLATLLCKFSFFLLSALCIPCIIEMEALLQLWLKEVPLYAVLFSQMALMASLVDTLTLGLSVANEAIGNIKQYNIVIASIKLLTLPISLLFMYVGLGAYGVVIGYVGMEFISGIARLPFLHKTGGLNVINFVKRTLFPQLAPVILCVVTCIAVIYHVVLPFRFLITFALGILVYVVSFYLIALSKEEKEFVINLIKKIL